MPELPFVTVPTDEVLNKEGKVRFPGTARMHEAPVDTVGVLQKDDAFRTMAPDVGVLPNIGELPQP